MAYGSFQRAVRYRSMEEYKVFENTKGIIRNLGHVMAGLSRKEAYSYIAPNVAKEKAV